MIIYKNYILFRFIRAIALFCFLLVVLSPFFCVFINAFNLGEFFKTNDTNVLFSNFKWLVEKVDIKTGLLNSLIRSIIVPLFTTLFTFGCAYSLSVTTGIVRKTMYGIVSISLYISLGPVFSYLNMSVLKLTGSFWVYVLPYLVNPLYVLILTVIISDIPKDYRDTARICGASELGTSIRVYFPMLAPSLISIYVLCFIIQWNDYIDTLLYNFPNPELYTLQYMNYAYLTNTYMTSNLGGIHTYVSLSSIRLSMTLLMIVPVILLVISVRKPLLKLFLRRR